MEGLPLYNRKAAGQGHRRTDFSAPDPIRLEWNFLINTTFLSERTVIFPQDKITNNKNFMYICIQISGE